jgi:hypothetical protein
LEDAGSPRLLKSSCQFSRAIHIRE